MAQGGITEATLNFPSDDVEVFSVNVSFYFAADSPVADLESLFRILEVRFYRAVLLAYQ